MTLEEIFKKRGWSDADIAALAPSWTPKMRADLEAAYGEVDTERTALKARDEDWQRRLDTEWQPRVTAEEKKAQTLQLEVANLREQLKIAKDYGYLTPEAEAKAEQAVEAAAAKANAASASAYDPKAHPTWDDVKKFGNAEALAIARANNIAQEYRYLTGKELFEYETQIDGQTVRGMEALLMEQQRTAPTQRLDFFASKKFDFDGKRAEKAAQRQKEHDDAIRREEAERVRGEMAAQYGNPNMRLARPSLHPVVPPKPASGKQPWEVSKGELKNARITRALQIEANKGAA